MHKYVDEIMLDDKLVVGGVLYACFFCWWKRSMSDSEIANDRRQEAEKEKDALSRVR